MVLAHVIVDVNCPATDCPASAEQPAGAGRSGTRDSSRGAWEQRYSTDIHMATGYGQESLKLPQGSPLPCWWSWVVRGRASCCGHDVLPLSVDDPGGVVTRSSRTLVTADKGNGPQCVRSFVTWVRDRSSTGWPCTHAARGGTKMNIEDIEVFIGTGRRQGASTGPLP